MQNDSLFKRSSYHFDLPEELIAHEPLAQRDESRLLVVHRSAHRIEHRKISDLPKILDSSYVLVANNTEVFKSRLLGTRILPDGATGGKVEFFLLKSLSADGLSWLGLMKASASIQPGFKFAVPKADGTSLIGTVTERTDSSNGTIYKAEFEANPILSDVGEVPLPPYIVARRKSLRKSVGSPSTKTKQDELNIYNTVYAQKVGSVAAPTAGRHFTKELILKLQNNGIAWKEITLHVGIGTFKPVEADDIRDHQMHPEPVWIEEKTMQELFAAKVEGKKILAVGTTSTRALEGVALAELTGAAGNDINLFIHPGSMHQWRVVDALLTNFHLPESTLLMMVADLIGSLEWTKEIYQAAVKEQYRFFSYGDAMLILE